MKREHCGAIAPIGFEVPDRAVARPGIHSSLKSHLTEFPAKAGTSTGSGAKAVPRECPLIGAIAPQWLEIPALAALGREFNNIACKNIS